MHTRNVYRYRHGLIAFVDPTAHFLAGAFPHISIKFYNKPVLLKYRNKLLRTDHTFVRLYPAHQSFRADYRFFGNAVFGLKVHYKFFVLQRVVHFVLYLFAYLYFYFLILSVIADVFQSISFYLYSRDSRSVAHHAARQRFIIYKIHAESERIRHIFKAAQTFFKRSYKTLNILLLFVRREYHKNIGAKTRKKLFFTAKYTQHIVEIIQQFGAFSFTVSIIY